MFKQLPSESNQKITVTINGNATQVTPGITVAAAALSNGLRFTRDTPISNTKRAPFCMMGVCFECLMVIDGQANQRACATYVAEGMTIEAQHGVGPAIEVTP